MPSGRGVLGGNVTGVYDERVVVLGTGFAVEKVVGSGAV